MIDYGLPLWGDNNFTIHKGAVSLNTETNPSLLCMVEEIRAQGIKGPLLLRFPHLIRKQIETIYGEFERAMQEFNYNGGFKAVFPLKVNQFPTFIDSLLEAGESFGYGLEAGSKSELIIAMALNTLKTPITVNGFKDYEMISLGFIAKKMGHDITLTIEGLGELETIIEIAEKYPDHIPNVGLRIRLHNVGNTIWGKSGGINAKFGLTSTEIIEAARMMVDAGIIDSLSMIHFHIGSQLRDIGPLKKVLREAGHIYAELRKLGAQNLNAINLGGGLAIEYAQHKNSIEKNYSLEEFSNDVVYLLKTIAADKGVKEPVIYTESGRFIAAPHAVLIAPVLELFSQEYSEKLLRLKVEGNPPLISELNSLYHDINRTNAREYLHDALDHMESLLTLFDLGYIDLQDRSNTEILVNLIIKKALVHISGNIEEIEAVSEVIQERYLVNFSLFQSLPDFWGLQQHFPVMPIHKLDTPPSRSASIWDITCDSDGEIPFDRAKPLFLHDVNVEEENYYLGFFLVGAYQETLGMNHNLFTHPTEATIILEDSGYTIKDIKQANSLLDILYDMDYDIDDLQTRLKQRIESSLALKEEEKQQVLGELYIYLSENGYLKTTK